MKTIIGQEETKLLFTQVWVHFGFPSSIISNRDSRFLGIFWKTLWERMDTKLGFSTMFYPKTDGKTEVISIIIWRHGMNNLCIFNTHTTKHSILPKKNHFLKLVLAIYLKLVLAIYLPHPLTLCMGEKEESKVNGHVRKDNIFVERIQQIHLKVYEKLEKSW
jgi:hypothetical protein